MEVWVSITYRFVAEDDIESEAKTRRAMERITPLIIARTGDEDAGRQSCPVYDENGNRIGELKTSVRD